MSTECSTCHWWLRCSYRKKEKQIASNERCPEWRRLITEGIESGWT